MFYSSPSPVLCDQESLRLDVCRETLRLEKIRLRSDCDSIWFPLSSVFIEVKTADSVKAERSLLDEKRFTSVEFNSRRAKINEGWLAVCSLPRKDRWRWSAVRSRTRDKDEENYFGERRSSIRRSSARMDENGQRRDSRDWCSMDAIPHQWRTSLSVALDDIGRIDEHPKCHSSPSVWHCGETSLEWSTQVHEEWLSRMGHLSLSSNEFFSHQHRVETRRSRERERFVPNEECSKGGEGSTVD